MSRLTSGPSAWDRNARATRRAEVGVMVVILFLNLGVLLELAVMSGAHRLLAAATRSAARSRGWLFAPPRDNEVRTTQMVSLAGSAQHSVPVEPVWPKVCSEHPGLPDSWPTANPNPRDVKPALLWFLVISRAVSGLTTLPRAPRNSSRNLARSGAEA